jgi:hypothetical protein
VLTRRTLARWGRSAVAAPTPASFGHGGEGGDGGVRLGRSMSIPTEGRKSRRRRTSDSPWPRSGWHQTAASGGRPWHRSRAWEEGKQREGESLRARERGGERGRHRQGVLIPSSGRSARRASWRQIERRPARHRAACRP